MKLSPTTTWVGLIVLLLSGSVASNLFVLFVYAGSPGEALEEDWEVRAQEWDRTQAQRTLNRALGWKLADSDWHLEDGQSSFSGTLRDRQGDPLSVESATWVAFQRLRPDVRYRGDATLSPAGMNITLPTTVEHPVELSIDLQAEGQRFTHTWIVYPPKER